jgi:hypothetical protein
MVSKQGITFWGRRLNIYKKLFAINYFIIKHVGVNQETRDFHSIE